MFKYLSAQVFSVKNRLRGKGLDARLNQHFQIPLLTKEGTGFRSVKRENPGWLHIFCALNHPGIVRWTLHDAVPSLFKAGNFRRKFANTLATVLIVFVTLIAFSQPAKAQFFDPNNALILNTLRDISFKNHLSLQEQRLQTAKMVQQLQQFYDSYTLLRSDIEFSQSLYRDFKSVESLDLTESYVLSDFIINADRPSYWLPSTSNNLNRTIMSTDGLLNNFEELQKTYESFAISVTDDQAPDDAVQRRHNALVGQQAYSQMLFEYALKCEVLAKTYDSLATELQRQVSDQSNRYTPGERTQLMVEAVKLRDLSNSYYEKHLDLTEKAHKKELEMFDDKLNFLEKNRSWDTLKKQVNSTSKVRYGFFDLIKAPFE